MEILSFFSKGGVPQGGLSPTITIKTLDGIIEVDTQPMTEVVDSQGGADGFYAYEYNPLNGTEYIVISEGYDNTLDSPINYWGGQLIEEVSLSTIQDLEAKIDTIIANQADGGITKQEMIKILLSIGG